MQSPSFSQGWILGREQRPGPDGAELIYWLSTESGPLCVSLPGQPYRGFILESEQAAWRQWLGARSGWQLTPVPAQSFARQPVLSLELSDHSLWQTARQQAEQQGWALLEADIRPQERYLMERFIRAGVAVKHQDHRLLAARPANPTHLPSLVSLDIECSRHGELYSIGFYSATDQRVLMVGEPSPSDGRFSLSMEFVADEAALLRGLLDWFEQHDPDGIIGWAVAGFDLALLHKRAAHHGLRLALGRDGSEPRFEQRAGPGRDCVIAGRLVLDGIEWLKAAFYQFDSYALDAVATELLGEGKACDDSAHRMAEIEHNFHHDKWALGHYNLKDCELVWRIFEHTRLLEFVLARGQMTGLELDRTGGSVAAFTFRYLPLLHRSGFVAPDLTDTNIPPSPGGYVMDSRPGLYRNVLVLDFKSLYPSIIRSFLIDPMGMVAAEAEADPSLLVEGYRGARFHRQHHRLPALIAELAQQREQAKQAKDQPLSQAIKILMNSFYGVLGAAGCRFHDPRLASSITLRGHDIMKATREWVEGQGAQVIYGDTDSLFVHLGDDKTPQWCQQQGQALVAGANAYWQQSLQKQGLESALELEFETQFDHFFMPTIRGSEQGSKKRYVGAIEQQGKLRLVFKGMETVRSDWTPLARQLQQSLYQHWFEGKPVTPLLKQWIARVRDGECDELLVYRKRLRRDLTDYAANPPHVQAARLANEHAGRTRYRRGSRIAYVITALGAEPLESARGKLDYEHYVEKQIRPVAEPVLAAINSDFEQLDGGQIGLF
ncbi:DNA polymerase II [Ferrimonas marina]|uniref:DNA polymerase n=1 Tax=Ferrimonas marina TaxID=299255 RepID=A0A1M5RNV9_9GAMM|nr:DNA polymerase II [Ferrimonas marina]SHH28047.1 DNA polymerase-2 [Ferrimonas marina]